jgi:hypothetical protein
MCGHQWEMRSPHLHVGKVRPKNARKLCWVMAEPEWTLEDFHTMSTEVMDSAYEIIIDDTLPKGEE